MKVKLYKIKFNMVYDNKMTDRIRSIFKNNGFSLYNEGEDILDHWTAQPDGYNYTEWNNVYAGFTHADYPIWQQEKEECMLLTAEEFADIVFWARVKDVDYNQVGITYIEVEHPVEIMMNELSESLTKGFSNYMINLLKQQTTKENQNEID